MKKITITIEDDDGSRQVIEPHIGNPGQDGGGINIGDWPSTWPSPSPSLPSYPQSPLPSSPYTNEDNGWVNGYDVCAHCPNSKKNGGSGICMCAIPSLYGPNRVTC